jgi:PAS domain S-box-containing protein
MKPVPPISIPDPPTPEIVFDRALLDQFPTLVWIDDLRGQCLYMNRFALTFTGRTFEEERGQGWLETVHPADRDNYVRTYQLAVAQHRVFETEFRLRRHDGEFCWMFERARPLHNTAGAVAGYIGFSYDITQRREADIALREIEEQVRLLGLATRDMVWSWDARSDRVIHNEAFAETLGDVPGPYAATVSWWKQRVHPADLDRVVLACSAALREGRADISYEYRFRKRDGTYAQVDDRACFVRDRRGGLVRVLGAMRDISKRKRVEEAHARFTRILESTSDFVGISTAGGLLLYINAAGRKILDWSPEQAAGGVHLAMIHPDWATEIIIEEGIPTAIRDGTWTGETALLTSDGREVPVSHVVISHRNANGDLEFLSAIMRDISDRKREEVARIEWANRYDAAIHASGQVLFDWNSVTGDITYGGDTEQLLGYATGEMAGGLARFRQLIHGDDVGAFDQEVQRVIATRDPFRLGFRLRHMDGRDLHIEAKGYFFLDREGRIGRMVGFLADVSSQRSAQDELSRAQEGLEIRVAERTAELARANAVIVERAMQQSAVAQLGQRALADTGLEALFDDATELVRKTLKVDLCSVFELTPEGLELVPLGLAGWPGTRADYRIPAQRQSQTGYALLMGETVIVEDMATETRFTVSQPVRDSGAVSGVSVVIQGGEKPIGVLNAFTLQRRAFTQDDVNFLQTVANVLTAAIERTRAEESVRFAQEQAEGANRAKSEFLSRMSHELRTPLNAILGFTQLLEIDTPSASQAESIGHISRAGQHLLALINEVLDIARIESGHLALAPEAVDLPPFIREAVAVIRPLAENHGIDLTIDPSCEVARAIFADLQKLKDVLLNLLANAVKYNRPEGRVIIACASRAGRGRITVTDTGVGIAADKLDRLFVPFERLGAESTDIEGAGIGLALSQRIVAALHGELGVVSTPGEGSVFWIELPLADLAPSAADIASDVPESRLRKLLYVEDQDLNLRLVERILSHHPEYQLVATMQGSLALDLAREHRPDAILLDLNLPDIPGDEILRRLKADAELQEIPVIMVSADALGDRITQLLSLGASGYLTKPYRVREFFDCIDKVLGAEGREMD